MFNLTSLLGAQSSSPASQSIVEFDGGIKILIDVGWSEDFDASQLKQLDKHVPTLSFILLTHATTAHLGAYAHCCKHIPLFSRVPVYATEPVIALGRTLLQDVYSSSPLAASRLPAAATSLFDSESAPVSSFTTSRDHANSTILLQPPSHIDIAAYFNSIHPLKYSQPHEPLPSPLSPPLNGLTITAYSAGHTLGGTIWHIQSGLESVVYAVDWNQAREHVLSGAAWLGAAASSEVIEGLRRPTALVCSSRGSQRVALAGGRKRRDEMLLDLIRGTVARGGTVLIPSDSSARVLELAYLLEEAWTQAKQEDAESSLRRAKLYLASATSTSTMTNARRMLEWMDPNMVRELENASQNPKEANGTQHPQSRNAPFEFSFMKLIETKSRVNRILSRSGPKVIIASDTSLEWGFSQMCFEVISSDKNNLIILTERNAPVSPTDKGLGRQLWDIWVQKSGVEDIGASPEESPPKSFDADGVEVINREIRTAQLTGRELNVYQQYLARQRQLHTTLNPDRVTSLETGADVVDDNSSTDSESTEDEDEEQQGKALNAAAALAHGRHKLGLTDAELGIDILVRRKGYYDYDVRGKKGRERMFPVVAAKRNQRNDEFGDSIRPEDYLRAEERDDSNGEDARDGVAKKEVVGQKRKWDEVGNEPATNGKRAANGFTRRRKAEDGQPDSTIGVITNGGNESDDSDDEDAPDEARIEGPVKAVISAKTLRLNLRIAFVDFSGLHDKRSLQMLIPLIRPRKLILIGGEQQETSALAADCRQLLRLDTDTADHDTDIFTPAVGVVVNASVDTNAWSVTLSKPLLKRLQWQNVRGLGVVALSGRLRAAGEEEMNVERSNKRQKSVNGISDDAVSDKKAETNGTSGNPILDLMSLSTTAGSRIAAQPIHVGDIRLADLRKSLQDANYTAEFRGEGTLVINNLVAVRKSGTGRIELEGLVSLGAIGRTDSTFYDTKRKVYDMLAVVSGT